MKKARGRCVSHEACDAKAVESEGQASLRRRSRVERDHSDLGCVLLCQRVIFPRFSVSLA